MGQRPAPLLAVCFMIKIERTLLESLPLMYCSCIDDRCIMTLAQFEMDILCSPISSQSRFRCHNTQIKVSHGVVSVKR